MTTVNPLHRHFARTVGKRGSPSRLLIYFALGLVSVSLWILPLNYRASIWPTIQFIRNVLDIMVPLWYLQMILNVAGAGAGRIARDRASEWYQLVWLTNVTDRQIVTAYVWGALRRVHRGLAFISGYSIAVVSISMWGMLMGSQSAVYTPWYAALMFLFIAGLVIWIGLAALIGSAVGLYVRGDASASLGAATIVLVGFIAWFVGFWVLLYPTLIYAVYAGTTIYNDLSQRYLSEAIATVGLERGCIVVLLPLALGLLLIWRLPRRARRGL